LRKQFVTQYEAQLVINSYRWPRRLSARGELVPCPPRTVGPGSIDPGHILRHQHFRPSPSSCLTALQITVSHAPCSPCAYRSGSNQGGSVPYTPGTGRGQRCRRHSGAGGRWQSAARSRFVRKIVFCAPACSSCSHGTGGSPGHTALYAPWSEHSYCGSRQRGSGGSLRRHQSRAFCTSCVVVPGVC